MNKLLTTLLILIFCSLNTLEAQVLKRIGNRVSNRVERTISRKIEDKAAKKTEEVIDDILEGEEKKAKEKREGREGDNSSNTYADSVNAMSGMLEGILNAQNVEVNDSYTFYFTATMLVENSQSKNKPSEVVQSFGKNAVMSRSGENQGLIINDFDNEAAIMIDEDKHTAQVMSLAWMKKVMQQEMPQDPDGKAPVIRKTGRTKTMHGYTCYEYIMEDEDAKITTWFAPDVTFSYKDYLSGFTKMFGYHVGNIPQDKGYVMEMDMLTKKDNETVHMKVTEISEKEITVDMGDYEVMNIMGN